MSRPCFFTVELVLGQPTPVKYWDELPRAPIRNLQYVLRLDEQPNGEALTTAPLGQLFATYLHMKRRGKLPPRWQPPKPPPKESALAG